MRLGYIFLFFIGSYASFAQETYVLVHGAWGGGWAWKEVDSLISGNNNTVYRPTLTGLGERLHLMSADVNLETHIQDIVNVILFENLNDVILMGHSYGGMVITGVADRVPERIKRMIYVDAHLPRNGESILKDLVGNRGASLLSMEKEGALVPSWLTGKEKLPYDVPHPLETLKQPIVLKNNLRLKIPALYILTVDEGKEKPSDSFYYAYERAKAMGFQMEVLRTGHNAQWSEPVKLANLLMASY